MVVLIVILIHGAGSCEHVSLGHTLAMRMRTREETSPLRVFAGREGVGYLSIGQPWNWDPSISIPGIVSCASHSRREAPAWASLVKQARLPTRGAYCGLNRKLDYSSSCYGRVPCVLTGFLY
ncbi:hypothetical protein HDV64DRAFT_247213 [Trichoderma sp. TUCIM 5745]